MSIFAKSLLIFAVAIQANAKVDATVQVPSQALESAAAEIRAVQALVSAMKAELNKGSEISQALATGEASYLKVVCNAPTVKEMSKLIDEKRWADYFKAQTAQAEAYARRELCITTSKDKTSSLRENFVNCHEVQGQSPLACVDKVAQMQIEDLTKPKASERAKVANRSGNVVN